MATEIMSEDRSKPVVVEAGFFYSISREGNVVRFKPGRKKKEPITKNPEAYSGGVEHLDG